MGIKIPPLLVFAFLFALQPGTDSIIMPRSMPNPRPLCSSQFALVNYACSSLPLSPLPSVTPVEAPLDPFPDSDYALPDSDQSPPHSHHSPSHGHHSPSHSHHSPPHSLHSRRGNGKDQRHRRNNSHDRHRQHGHGHEHSHRHRHEHGNHPQEVECCRWLRQVDPECVCEVLVHLPTFLSRPNHVYTAVVGETCNVTYACGGRLRP